MMPAAALSRLLAAPSPSDLGELQYVLLATEGDPMRADAARRALLAAAELNDFLCELASKLSAREMSHVASLMDIGAVGAAALEGVADRGPVSLRQISLAALSETLMVLASRQYVKAWSRELEPLARRAAWRVRDELWHLSVAGQPDLPGDERARAIDAILAPAVSPEASPDVRHALLGRLLQIVLVIHVVRALGAATDTHA